MENQLRISHFDLVYSFGIPSIKALLAYSPFLRDFEASQNYQIDCHGQTQKFPLDLHVKFIDLHDTLVKALS